MMLGQPAKLVEDKSTLGSIDPAAVLSQLAPCYERTHWSDFTLCLLLPR
jgi:hypothetical protein